MRCVCVAVAVGVLLAGCTSWVGDNSAADFIFQGSSARAVQTADADVVGDRDALALRQSAWHPARIRGDAPTSDAAGFCKDVAFADATSASYDVATRQRVEALRLAQCHDLMTP